MEKTNCGVYQHLEFDFDCITNILCIFIRFRTFHNKMAGSALAYTAEWTRPDGREAYRGCMSFSQVEQLLVRFQILRPRTANSSVHSKHTAA